VVVEELNMTWDVSLMTLGREVSRVCQLDFSELKHQFSHIPASRLPHLCFNAQYVFILLHHGFNMDLLGTRILFLTQINGVSLSWPLGSTIYEINAMPWDIDGCPNAIGATSYARESADKPLVPFRDSFTESEQPESSLPAPLTPPHSEYFRLSELNQLTSTAQSGSLPLFLLFGTMLMLCILLLGLFRENKKLKKKVISIRARISNILNLLVL